MSFNWTYERVEMLKTLWADSYTATEITEKMPGTTRNSIIGKVHRLKLTGRVRVASVEGSPARSYKPRKRRSSMLIRAPEIEIEEVHPDASLPPDQSSFAVTFEQLCAPSCRWPIGESPFQYCGAQKISNGPYCRRHHELAYQPPMRRAG